MATFSGCVLLIPAPKQTTSLSKKNQLFFALVPLKSKSRTEAPYVPSETPPTNFVEPKFVPQTVRVGKVVTKGKVVPGIILQSQYGIMFLYSLPSTEIKLAPYEK